MKDIKEFEQLSDEAREILLEWFSLTGEVITVLGLEGKPQEETVQMLRKVLIKRNLRYVQG